MIGRSVRGRLSDEPLAKSTSNQKTVDRARPQLQNDIANKLRKLLGLEIETFGKICLKSNFHFEHGAARFNGFLKMKTAKREKV